MQSETDTDRGTPRERREPELEEVGGGADDASDAMDDDERRPTVSAFPCTDVAAAISCCFQEKELSALASKNRKSKSDINMKAYNEASMPLLGRPGAVVLEASVRGLAGDSSGMFALQTQNFKLAKKRQDADAEDLDEENWEAAMDNSELPNRNQQPVVPEIVPIALK